MGINQDELLESKELRDKLVSKLEVLEKTKKLILLPSTELMTTKMVAEYFEVSQEVIRDNIRRNKDEITENGMKMMSYGEIKEIINSENISHLKISRQGTNIFSKRAVLNIAMLLRDSEVAKKVRTTLLDQQEEMTDEQKVKSITEEEQLLLAIMKSSSPVEQAIAVSELNNYHNRHKAELNVLIEKQKPKADSYDTFMSAEGYQKMNQVAKSLGMGRNTLFEFLRNNQILMKDNTPYQRFINNGYFKVREIAVDKGFAKEMKTQTLVTAKGVDYISKKLKEQKLINT